MFFLLDNAIRHKDVFRDLFHSNVAIISEGAELSLSVQSRMSSDTAAVAASHNIFRKIAELKENLEPAKVIREGGSGFAKIVSAVRYEFKQNDPVVNATNENSVLHVSVKCSIAGLIV